MTLKTSLDAFVKAFADLQLAVRADDKTPLQNSLALDEAKEIFATTAATPNVVVFADVNDLKFINGRYGLSGGDAAINQVGIEFNRIFVGPMLAEGFRVGGDEFIILLHDNFLEEFRETVRTFRECQVRTGETDFSVGVSFGYSVKIGEIDFETIRARAEMACNHAKTLGAGICVEWTEAITKTALQSLRIHCSECLAVTSCYVPEKMGLTSVQFCAACGTRLERTTD